MRYFYLLLSLMLFLSCKSSEKIPEPVKFKIWEITSFVQKEEEFIPEIIKQGFVIHNIKLNKTYIHYILSESKTKELENLWIKSNKNLVIDEFNILQELSYTRDTNNLTINNIDTNYVINGQNTQKVVEKINNLVFTERNGESGGVISLIYRIWNPTILNDIPYPTLKKGSSFSINTNENNIKLKNEDTTIILRDDGTHDWIGY